jgi:Tfp pilus assembly protein PilO
MKTRDQLILSLALAAAVAAAFWFLALAPKREEASKLTAEVTRAEVLLNAATTKALGAEQAKARYAGDYATVARLGKAVPPIADVPSLLFQLDAAARAANVDLRKISVETATPTAPGGTDTTSSSGISPTPFSFTFEGSFFSLNRLLREIGRFSRVNGKAISVSGRLLTLDQVNLSASRRGLPHISAEITARAYVAPLASAQPAAAAPATTAPAAQASP